MFKSNYDVTNITTEDHRVLMLRYTSEAAPVDEILNCSEVLVIAIHGAGDAHSVHLQLLDHCEEITHEIQIQVEVQVEMSIDRTDINECINLTAAAVQHNYVHIATTGTAQVYCLIL